MALRRHHCEGVALADRVPLRARCSVRRAISLSSTEILSESIVGVGVGGVDVVSVVKPLTDVTLKRVTLSAGRRYSESGIGTGQYQ